MRNKRGLQYPQHFSYLYEDLVMDILLSFVEAAICMDHKAFRGKKSKK